MNDTIINKSYSKFQYSVFLRNGREEQMVIRADDWDDFLEAKKKIDLVLKKRKKEEVQAVSTPQTPQAPQEPAKSRWCSVHEAVMTQSISKKTGKPYFSHRNEAGQICFGKEYIK